MNNTPSFLRQHWAISLLILTKILLHVWVINRYGFHRDEFLYLVQGNHLQWGYLEVPPFIAVIGKIATTFFGTALWGIRLFPLMASLATLWLVYRMVRLMGGSNFAVLLSGLAFLFSPSLLRSGMLFQPTVFNQLCWTLLAYWTLKIVITGKEKYWFVLGVTMGVAFLVKYSVLFYIFGLLAGALLTSERKWFSTRWPYLAAAIALVIVFPNLYWQYAHDWPVIHHMDELARTQLRYMSPLGFMSGQLLMHFVGVIIWLPGLIYVFLKRGSRFRIFGWAYVLVIAQLLFLSGKSYYSIGAYPVLIALGGIAWTVWLKEWKAVMILSPALVLLGLLILPYGIPILSIDRMEKYGAFMADKYGLEVPLIWEDGVRRSLPQDYADMFGWEEMVAKTADIYHNLDPEVRKKTIIYGGSYSHTATANFYRHKYNLPEIVSMSNSFLFWAPDEVDFHTQIELDDVPHYSSPYFDSVEIVDSIENKYAREPGYIILNANPSIDVPSTWKSLLKEARAEFNVR